MARKRKPTTPPKPAMPRRLKIGGMSYAVTRPRPSGMLEHAVGSCLLGGGKIRVLAGLPDEQAGMVLMHEVIEALNYHGGVRLTHRQIEALESGIVAALRDNPSLAVYLLGGK